MKVRGRKKTFPLILPHFLSKSMKNSYIFKQLSIQHRKIWDVYRIACVFHYCPTCTFAKWKYVTFARRTRSSEFVWKKRSNCALYFSTWNSMRVNQIFMRVQKKSKRKNMKIVNTLTQWAKILDIFPQWICVPYQNVIELEQRMICEKKNEGKENVEHEKLSTLWKWYGYKDGDGALNQRCGENEY